MKHERFHFHLPFCMIIKSFWLMNGWIVCSLYLAFTTILWDFTWNLLSFSSVHLHKSQNGSNSPAFPMIHCWHNMKMLKSTSETICKMFNQDVAAEKSMKSERYLLTLTWTDEIVSTKYSCRLPDSFCKWVMHGKAEITSAVIFALSAENDFGECPPN